MGSNEIVELFSSVDDNGDGFIEQAEFQRLCLRLKIEPSLSSDIFDELDKDCDGKISAAEFMSSLNDHLTTRRRSVAKLELASSSSDFEQKEREAEKAWDKYVLRLSPEAMEYLKKRYREFKEIYIQMHTRSDTAECVSSFEVILASLLEELFCATKEKQLAEEIVRKERQSHVEQLKDLEEELEAHILKVSEMAARDAEIRFQEENERIRLELEMEIAELKTRVSVMSKTETLWGKDSTSNTDLKRRLADALQENRRLVTALTETEAALSLSQSESMRIRNRYNFNERSVSCFAEESGYHPAPSSVATYAGIRQGLPDSRQCRPFTYTSGDKLPDFRVVSPDSAIASFETDPSSKVPSQLTPDSSLLDELVEAKFYGIDEPSIFSCEDSVQSYNLSETRPKSTDRVFKVVFAGDPAVGKSSFITRVVDGRFVSDIQSTVGVDFKTKSVEIDKRQATLQLWDTAGQERFRSMTQTYFRRADGVILLFDVTNERSFLDVRQWVSLVEDNVLREVPMVLCGNKADLRECTSGDGIRCVSLDECQKLSKESRLPYFETSSKTGLNLLDVIKHLTRYMHMI